MSEQPDTADEMDIIEKEAFERDRLADMKDLIAHQQRQLEHQQQEIEQLKEKANVDYLTQVLNRDGFDLLINKEWSRIERLRHDQGNEAHLSIVCIDIDDFKGVNDDYGHPAGDAALRSVADVMASRLRDYDIIARFGGDEFVIGLIDADESSALEIAGDIVRLVSEEKIRYNDDKEFKCEISAGVSSLRNQESWDELYSEADRALYATKGAGKGHVVAFQPEE